MIDMNLALAQAYRIDFEDLLDQPAPWVVELYRRHERLRAADLVLHFTGSQIAAQGGGDAMRKFLRPLLATIKESDERSTEETRNLKMFVSSWKKRKKE
jgi:hypothetical protein